jgi:pimeloyl-ACP methyl ester carboxylesterase
MSNSESFVLEDGSYIRYKKSGSGRPLILLHTIRNRLEYFDQVTPFLAKFFTVYAIDLPGFGDSPVNSDVNYDQLYMTKAVADFVVKKKLSKLTLVGESIGGVLCATVGSMLPKKVERIFVFNPYDYDTFFGEGIRRANRFARFIIWSMSLPIVGSLFTALENKLILWFIFRGGVYDKKAITYSYVSLLSTSIRKSLNVYHTRNVFSNFKSWTDSKKLYADLTVPITLVYGEHDWSSLIERSKSRALLSPQNYIELENAGHFSFLEASEKAARIIKSYG